MFENLFRNLTPITRNIIILNVIVYVSAMFLPKSIEYLAAFFPTSPFFKSWQIITHMFMHGGIMHIAFNMLTFASFGPVLERFLGDKKFLILYFLSGIGAFLLFNLWEYYQIYNDAQPLISQGISFTEILHGNFDAVPSKFGNNAQEIATILSTPMVGASGALFGVVAAFSALYPNAEMYIMFIPFPIKAKILLPIVIIGSLFLGINNYGNIAHFAHIGGAIVGFILIKIWGRNRYRIN